MLSRQTEERGNFIIFTSLAAISLLLFLNSKLQTSILFRKKILEDELMSIPWRVP